MIRTILIIGMWSYFAFPLFSLAGDGAPDWLSIDPAHPVANSSIDAVILWGGSQGICLEQFFNPQNTTTDVTRINNEVILDLVAEPDFAVCAPFPVPFEFPLLELEAGQYQLTVNRVDRTTLFPASPADRILLGSMEFVVGAAPVAVPTNQGITLAGLMLILLLIGLWKVRSR